MGWDEASTPMDETLAALCRHVKVIIEKCRVMANTLHDVHACPQDCDEEQMSVAAGLVIEARQLIDEAFEEYAEALIANRPALPPLPKGVRPYLQPVVTEQPEV